MRVILYVGSGYQTIEVSKIVSPLLSTEKQSISKLNHARVLTVSRALLKAASMYLPAISHRKKKTLIKDEELRRQCKESHETWMKWKRAKIQARDLMFKENNHHHTPKTGMSAEPPILYII